MAFATQPLVIKKEDGRDRCQRQNTRKVHLTLSFKLFPSQCSFVCLRSNKSTADLNNTLLPLGANRTTLICRACDAPVVLLFFSIFSKLSKSTEAWGTRREGPVKYLGGHEDGLPLSPMSCVSHLGSPALAPSPRPAAPAPQASRFHALLGPVKHGL